MSWTDDIRCLYCDGRLPLYRKITNGQFCSSAHRKAYWQEQESLAVECLHQTHDKLQAYRPAAAIETILGKPEATQEPERPRWLTLANTGQVPMIGFLPDPTPVYPRWIEEQSAGAGAMPADSAMVLRRPILIYTGDGAGFVSAGPVGIPLSERDSRILATARVEPAELRVQPVYHLAPDFAIEGVEIDQLVEIFTEEIPEIAGLLALLRPSPLGCEVRGRCVDSSPLPIVLRTRLPRNSTSSLILSSAPMCAGSIRLPGWPIANWAVCAADTACALDLRAEAPAPERSLSTPAICPRLRMAAGSRYPVRGKEPAAHSTEPIALAATLTDISLPDRSGKQTASRNAKQPVAPAPMEEPNQAGMVKLPRTVTASASGTARIASPGGWSIPQPLSGQPMRPRLGLEPINEHPGPAAARDFATSLPPYAVLETPAEASRANVWMYAIDFWNRAPRDLKLLAVAIPVLLGLALHPALPKVRVSSPANTTGMQESFEQAMNAQWKNVRQALGERAAVALDEDFRAGLDDWASRWTTRGDSSAEWSFDATGFVRPGPLALYKPSVGLVDYQMQFLGMIDKKALSWVVRAADFDNFYVVKLEVLKPGPLPAIGITRYAVVNGQADSRVDTVLPIDARSDTLYRVQMDVHGDDFSLTVQGLMADAWSEPRLKLGGIGFFSARGEESRVRWVQVTHQYDMLGRVCAYLAPYNISSTSGSFEP